MSRVDPIKALERKIGEHFTRLVYAALEDMQSESNGDIKYPHVSFNSYANICADKTAKYEGVTNVFTVSDPVRQVLARLFMKFTDEINETVYASATAEVAALVADMQEQIDESVAWLMYELAARFPQHTWGRLLAGDIDKTRYFSQAIAGRVTAKAGAARLLNEMDLLFDNFMRALAFICGRYLWCHKTALSWEVFSAILAAQGVACVYLETMEAGQRAKKPAAPRKKKTTTPSPADTPTDNTTTQTNTGAEGGEAHGDVTPGGDTQIDNEKPADPADLFADV